MFEALVVNWNMDPEIFGFGALSIRWYSLLFISGFVLGWFIFKWFFKREGVPESLLDPLLYTLLIGTIVGARLGHCLFYQPDYYLGSWKGFWEIFMPWKGGLASHGGTIALFIAMWWFARHYGRKYDFDFVWILDHLAIAVCFAATFIRLGNLCNSEIYGDVTNLPWGFIFELRGETEPKHPTQLYEALSYFLLGVFQILMYKYRLDKLYRGFFIGTFFIGCFGMRFLIEWDSPKQGERAHVRSGSLTSGSPCALEPAAGKPGVAAARGPAPPRELLPSDTASCAGRGLFLPACLSQRLLALS